MARAKSDSEGAEAGPPGADPEVQIFSSMKYRLMLLLKREGQADLEELSRQLRISQMAVYKHVKELEARGLLEHRAKRIGVGRPRLVFRPTSKADGIYPKAYSKVAGAAMEYVQERLGEGAAKDVFGELNEKAYEEYSKVVGSGGLFEKTRRLALARNADGYMAEAKAAVGGRVELLEHNCPVACLASRYSGFCEAERDLFGKLLGARVEVERAGPDGPEPCRFKVVAR